jgi:flavin reductase (DIM6/NTAB) family NADH-FMN oxidoreductase RutF
MEENSEQLRNAMRFWATGITVVTAAYEGMRHGMTVSSFTSVSLEPAQVLVSLQQNTRTHDLIMRSRAFGINILNDNQKEISDKFAGRIADEENRLSQVETFKIRSNIPFIKGGMAHLECKVVTTIGSGTHTIFIGEVLEVVTSEQPAEPLIYYNRKYRTLSES